MKMAQIGFDIEFRKKFQSMEFRYFYELAAKVTEYEELLKEESYQRKKSMGTYCQEVNQKVEVADLSATRTFTCPLLVEKTLDVWKKEQIVDTHKEKNIGNYRYIGTWILRKYRKYRKISVDILTKISVIQKLTKIL